MQRGLTRRSLDPRPRQRITQRGEFIVKAGNSDVSTQSNGIAGKLRHIATARQSHHIVALGIASNKIDCVLADATRRAKDRDTPHRHP